MFRTALISILISSTTFAGDLGRDKHAGWGDQIPPEDVQIQVPSSYDPSTPSPLLIMLHGYSSNGGDYYESWLQFWPDAEANGYLYAHPTGSVDSWGNHYWSATLNCCDYDELFPDHAGYLAALIDAASTKYNVDQNRVYFIGFSNGGYMCHRMACDYPEKVAAVISVSGATWLDPDNCPASEPVHVLEVHGTSDDIVLYEGGYDPWNPNHPYPGAVETVEQWAAKNGCTVQGYQVPGWFDVDWYVPGPETQRILYDNGCNDGGSATLWRLQSSEHSIWISTAGREAMFKYYADHQKPSSVCASDFDGDGEVNVADVLLLIGAWGPCPNCDEDLDGDGEVQVADLLLLIGNWGPCE